MATPSPHEMQTKTVGRDGSIIFAAKYRTDTQNLLSTLVAKWLDVKKRICKEK